ncbi:hypothetical protein ABIA43_007058 [Bradyrhizobium sp. USDA 328]
MASRVLYHGAEANKLLFNIRNGALTADSQGRIFFAERDWENCLIHGADRQMGESYAAKLRVDIPEGAQLVKNPTSGNPDARILKVEPGAKVPAKVEELYVRRGRVGASKNFMSDEAASGLLRRAGYQGAARKPIWNRKSRAPRRSVSLQVGAEGARAAAPAAAQAGAEVARRCARFFGREQTCTKLPSGRALRAFSHLRVLPQRFPS